MRIGVLSGQVVRGLMLAAAALALLGCATPASAATGTVESSAARQMYEFMDQFDGAGFSRATDLGGSRLYGNTLGRLTLKVDPALKAVALYDPVTKTITFSVDPRKVKASESMAFGKTVWHEVTHAIEDVHGDIGVFDNPEYAERNIDYMTHVADVALPVLERLEKQAKAGASVEKLRTYWEKYLQYMADAAKLPSTTQYPPDLALMRSWFGFRADPQTIKALYLSGKVLPGKQGENLRKALSLQEHTWTGRWSTNTALGDMVLTQSGSSVTGYMANTLDPPDAFVISGTLIENGMTLEGVIDQKDPEGYDWRFTATMRADWLAFSGPMWVATQESDSWTLEGTRE